MGPYLGLEIWRSGPLSGAGSQGLYMGISVALGLGLEPLIWGSVLRAPQDAHIYIYTIIYAILSKSIMGSIASMDDFLQGIHEIFKGIHVIHVI